MAAAFDIASKFKARDKFSSPVAKMTGKAQAFGNKAEKAFNRAERKTRALSKRVGGLTSNLSGMQQAFAGAFAVAGGSQVISSIDNLANLESQARNLFNVGKKDAEKFADRVQGISAKFEAQEGEILQVSNAVSKQMGISYQKAFGLIEEGFQKGGNVQGEFLTMLKEFPGQLKKVGLNARESFSIITQSQRQGFFSDKGVDAVKEARLQLAEMPKPAKEAVNKLFQSSNAAEEMTKRLNTGETTMFQEIQRISEAMKGADSDIKQMAVANVFKGPGEDAQKFVENLHTLNTSFDDVKSNMTPTAKSVDRMQAMFVKVKNTLLRSLVPALNKSMQFLSPVGKWMVNNKSTVQVIVQVILAATGAFLAFKTALFLTSLAFKVLRGTAIAYNAVIGLTNAAMGRSLVFSRANRTALIAHSVALKGVAIAQRIWNAAMRANPIGLIITGIGVLIGLVTAVTSKWDKWGAAVSLFMGPLGAIISLFKSFQRHWDMIKKAFQTKGIIAGLKAIGIAILDAILQPVQQLLNLVGKLPKWLGGGVAKAGADAIKEMRKQIGALGDDVEEVGNKAKGGNKAKEPNTRQAQTESFSRSIEERVEKMEIEVKDPNNRTRTKRKTGDNKNVRVTKNQGSFAER